MRSLTDHKLNGLNEALEITVLDEPGQGGACHQYGIRATSDRLPKSWTPDSAEAKDDGTVKFDLTTIRFQDGPIQEHGVNGISGEALMAIQIDRLRSFQAGPYACRENAIALTHMEDALMWLQKRTRDRIVRGVEGTSVK